MVLELWRWDILHGAESRPYLHECQVATDLHRHADSIQYKGFRQNYQNKVYHGDSGTCTGCEFTANVTSGASPLAVRFTDQSKGSPTSWNWNFGDGSISTEQNPDHTYTNARWPQIYTVTLTVSNTRGSDRITKTRYITVIPVPALGC